MNYIKEKWDDFRVYLRPRSKDDAIITSVSLSLCLTLVISAILLILKKGITLVEFIGIVFGSYSLIITFFKIRGKIYLPDRESYRERVADVYKASREIKSIASGWDSNPSYIEHLEVVKNSPDSKSACFLGPIELDSTLPHFLRRLSYIYPLPDNISMKHIDLEKIHFRFVWGTTGIILGEEFNTDDLGRVRKSEKGIVISELTDYNNNLNRGYSKYFSNYFDDLVEKYSQDYNKRVVSLVYNLLKGKKTRSITIEQIWNECTPLEYDKDDYVKEKRILLEILRDNAHLCDNLYYIVDNDKINKALITTHDPNTIDTNVVFVGGGVVSLVSAYLFQQMVQEQNLRIKKITIVESENSVAQKTSFQNGGHLTLTEGLCVARRSSEKYFDIDSIGSPESWLVEDEDMKLYYQEFCQDFIENFLKESTVQKTGRRRLQHLALFGKRSLVLWEEFMRDKSNYNIKKSSSYQYDDDGLLRIYQNGRPLSQVNEDCELIEGAIDKKIHRLTDVESKEICKEFIEEFNSFNKNKQPAYMIKQPGGCINTQVFCRLLMEELNKSQHIEFVYNTKVEQIVLDSGRSKVIRLVSNEGDIEANWFHFSTGTSPSYLSGKNQTINSQSSQEILITPIHGLAGITFNLAVTSDIIKRKIPYPKKPIKYVTDIGTIVISPFIGKDGRVTTVRIGGTFMYVGMKEGLNISEPFVEKNFAKLKKRVGEIFPDLIDYYENQTHDEERAKLDERVCIRPISSDLLPVIGFLGNPNPINKKINNAIFNGAQAFAGTSYSFACGEYAASMLLSSILRENGKAHAYLEIIKKLEKYEELDMIRMSTIRNVD